MNKPPSKITTTVRLPASMHKQVKLAAVQRNMTISEVVEEGIRLWAEQNDIELPCS